MDTRRWVGAGLAAAVVAVGLIAVVSAHLPSGTAIHPAAALAAATEPARAAASPEEAEEALADFAATRGSPFAGPCDATQSPRDVGHLCSRFVAEREPDGLRAYLVGRTFSEYSLWVFVARRDGRWVVVTDAPLDVTSLTLVIPWPP